MPGIPKPRPHDKLTNIQIKTISERLAVLPRKPSTAPSSCTARPTPTRPPAAVTDNDERKAAAEPDAEAPAPSPEAEPDMAAPSASPPPPSREKENLAGRSHKTPAWNELVVARVIGLANPGSCR